MMGCKGLTLAVRVMLVVFSLFGLARPMQHAALHAEAHHEERSNGPALHAQCVDCELDKLPVEPLVRRCLTTERGYPMDLQRSLFGRLMGDEVRGAMGRAPPAFFS